MTRNTKIWLLFITVLIALTTYAFVRFRFPKNCVDEIEIRYPYQKVSTQKSYKADCARENKQGIKFPIDKPAYATLHYDQFKPSVTLDSQQTNLILHILNDTASYIWGEIGTPHFDRRFSFHNETGDCIGYTSFSFDGQTYSTPHLAKMKWGMLTDEARKTLMIAIER